MTELETKGYTIIPQFFSDEEMDDLFEAMFTIANTIYRREFHNRQIPGPPSLWLLDRYISGLSEKNKSLIGEVYDTFAYSTPFLRLISSKKMEEVIDRKSAYCFTNRCRIDQPHDTRRTYGWHQEIFYTIPKGLFIQTWAPLFRDTTIVNGTIEIAVGSHLQGIARQSWAEKEGEATQIIVDQDIIDQYEQKRIEMKVGDLLLFTGHTAHRSGYNSSDEIRYSLVGMYHDMSNTEAHWPKPAFKHRGMGQKDYFDFINWKANGST